MIVSLLQVIIQLEDVASLKDKRRIVLSLKDRLYRKFRLAVAEVDLNDSIGFTQIGCAYVSNSREHGERVLQKAVQFIENESPGRLQDVSIISEQY